MLDKGRLIVRHERRNKIFRLLCEFIQHVNYCNTKGQYSTLSLPARRTYVNKTRHNTVLLPCYLWVKLIYCLENARPYSAAANVSVVQLLLLLCFLVIIVYVRSG